MYKLLITLFLSALLPVAGMRAQQLPVFSIDYNSSTLKNDSVKGALKGLQASLNIPLIHSSGNTFGTRIQYQSARFSGLTSRLNEQLSGLDLHVFLQRKWDEKHQLYLFAQVGAYSDFKDLDTKDFRFLLGARYLVKHSDKLSTGWGLAYARQFFGHQINPFIAINYAFTPRLKLSGLLPIRPVLTYEINDRISWVNEINGNVESYRLSASVHNNAFIQYSGWKVKSTCRYLVGKHHRFSAGLGFSRQSTAFFNDDAQNNWKIFTINLSQKNAPVETLKTKGLLFSLGYDFVL
ncbi:DUF6268 family outer membrane beta-barrel protein [Filimonas effusa]|uniref:DUF6268 domain-containing protein n=1 Tax=Filimonas effusa TaxID=2508721 RepID=A0A4Q1DAV2_9BACT|nr:DUF6268 family outer membrane beta-barrel protein [Filimonas effusa]RXK85693.1 hypothetical protein ESB13_02440 [Filimonas effusa]